MTSARMSDGGVVALEEAAQLGPTADGSACAAADCLVCPVARDSRVDQPLLGDVVARRASSTTAPRDMTSTRSQRPSSSLASDEATTTGTPLAETSRRIR